MVTAQDVFALDLKDKPSYKIAKAPKKKRLEEPRKPTQELCEKVKA